MNQMSWMATIGLIRSTASLSEQDLNQSHSRRVVLGFGTVCALLGSGCTQLVPQCDATWSLSSDLQNAVVLTWQTDYTAASWVEYEVDGHSFVTPRIDEARSDHSHTLLGLPPVTTVSYRAYTDNGRLTRTCKGEVTSGNPPGTVARYTVTQDATGTHDSNYVLVVNASEEQGGTLILNRAGEIVWYRDRPAGRVTSHAEVDPVTGHLLLFHQDADRLDASLSEMERVDWMGACHQRASLWGGHHSLVPHDDGALAWLAVDIREWTDPETGTLRTVVGDRLMRTEVDGSETELFSTWDWLPVDVHTFFDFPYYGEMGDWTHANGLSYSSKRGSYLMSLGHMDQVVEIDEQSGLLLGQYGGDDAQYSDDTTPISFPHSPQWSRADNLMLTTTDGTTVAVEYAIDSETGVLTEVWSHGREEALYSAALGEVQELDSGGHLVSFGMGALVQELNAEGEVIWSLQGRAGKDRMTSIRLLNFREDGLGWESASGEH